MERNRNAHTYFNSRPHKEVDEEQCKHNSERSEFQLTISQGGRLSCSQVCTLPNMYFNSRPHEEVDKFLIANAEKKKGFQLTTSRRGRRGIAPMWKAHDSVSTHDLTKRSTHHLSNTDHIDRVSTHDLSKRSTVGTIGRKTAVAFQLTTSRRGRRFIIFV